MSDRIPPPYRIDTDRTVIRCYHPSDAPLLCDAITESLEHLKPWMPWVASEPESVEVKAQKMRQFRGKFDLDEEYVYGIFCPDESKLLGGTGFHDRVGPSALEIGYWIHQAHLNQGLATEISAALVRVAFEICKLTRIEIRCDPNNQASARVPEKLGFTHDGTLRRRVTGSDGELKDSMIWSLFAEEYPNTPCANVDVVAYDARGEKLLT